MLNWQAIITRRRFFAAHPYTRDFQTFFLEAWSAGVPVISTVDPDRILQENSVGVHCESPHEILASISKLRANRSELAAMSKASLDYFRRNHEPNVAMGAFERYFRDVLEKRPAEMGST